MRELRAFSYRALQQGLLGNVETDALAEEEISLDDLAVELEDIEAALDDITTLKYVRHALDKRATEEIANREKCKDSERFKPLFERVQ